MKVVPNSVPVEISKLTSAVLNGELKRFPKVLQLDLESASQADYQALLQLVRYRAFGHQVLRSPAGQSEIQSLRVLINAGRFSEALLKAAAMDQQDPDVRLELARAQVFLGRFDQIAPLLADMIEDPRIAICTRGVAYQLMGHAQMEMGDLETATRSLESAQDLALTCGNGVGLVAANLFLSRSHAFAGRFRESQKSLDSALEEALSQGSFRWLLGYYRHASHLFFLAGEERCLKAAQAGILIADALKDPLFRYRGMIELSLMSAKFGRKLDMSPINCEMTAYASTSESDLKQWLDAIDGLAEPKSFFAKRFIAEAKRAKAGTVAERLDFDFLQSAHWILDRNAKVFIDLKSSKITAVIDDSPQTKMITILSAESEGVLPAKLFERVWKLRWSQNRHQNVLDVNIHRLGKLSGSLKLLRKDGALRLKHGGLLL